jgi:hypothetical protein
VLLLPLKWVAQLTTVSAPKAPELEWAVIVILVIGHKDQLGQNRVPTLLVLQLLERITSCLPRSITLVVELNFDNVRLALIDWMD